MVANEMKVGVPRFANGSRSGKASAGPEQAARTARTSKRSSELSPLPVPTPHKPPELDDLDELQRVVCWLVALGQTSAEIAQRLDIAQRTVELKRNQAAKVLGIRTWQLNAYCGRNWQWLQCDPLVRQFSNHRREG